MPTFTLAETLPHVIVKRVFEDIALEAITPCTPLTGLTLVLKPLVPVMLHEDGGVATV